MPEHAWEDALFRLGYRLAILAPLLLLAATLLFRRYPPKDLTVVVYLMAIGGFQLTVIFLVTEYYDPAILSPSGNQLDPLWTRTLLAYFVGMFFSMVPAMLMRGIWMWRHPEKSDS